MSKSKNRALFEVLEQRSEDDDHPSSSAVVNRSVRTDSKSSLLSDRKDSVVKPRTRSKKTKEETPATESRSMFSYDGRYVSLNFTTYSAAILLALVVMIVLSAYRFGNYRGFEAGKNTIQSNALDEIEAARRQQPDTNLVSNLLVNPEDATDDQNSKWGDSDIWDGSLEKVTWVKGNTYVIIQEFSSTSDDDAYHAQKFFIQQGIPASVVMRKNGRKWLISNKGFNLSDRSQKAIYEKFAYRIRETGALYEKSGGRYKCEGYPNKLTASSWDEDS